LNLDYDDLDVFKDGCGLFGIFGNEEAARITYLGLYALQHRGQESAGIAVYDGSSVNYHKDMGLVTNVFSEEILSELKGFMAIGHVRYSTIGSSHIRNAQPMVADLARGFLAIAHNGNIVNAHKLRAQLQEEGAIFQSTTDSELILHLIARSSKLFLEDKVVDAITTLRGAYSLLIMSPEGIMAVRDPWGFRPLSIGRIGNAYVVASETCALDIVDAEFIRDVEPGEIVRIEDGGIYSRRFSIGVRPSPCVFELIYFARPDSIVFGRSVYMVRREAGRQLAREAPADADMVVPIPDSGNCAALGYAEELGIPFEMGLVRSHYIGRTFIQPTQFVRDLGARIKYNPVSQVVAGKRVVVVDDSIVRGTTLRRLIKMLRKAGAREVHLRISFPPHRFPCYYGIDTPTRAELIASSHSLEEIRKYLRADSLAYLSPSGLMRAVSGDEGEFCTACYSGKYPVRFSGELRKEALEEGTRIQEVVKG
jgi:amidophosphoribosyltransferase